MANLSIPLLPDVFRFQVSRDPAPDGTWLEFDMMECEFLIEGIVQKNLDQPTAVIIEEVRKLFVKDHGHEISFSTAYVFFMAVRSAYLEYKKKLTAALTLQPSTVSTPSDLPTPDSSPSIELSPGSEQSES